VLGPDHSDVAISLDSLGDLYSRQGRYAEAQTMAERGIALSARAFGEVHPDVPFGLTILASGMMREGRNAEAKVALEKALPLWEQTLPDHADAARTLHCLATVCQREGDYEAAERFFERSLATMEASVGAGHSRLAEPLAEFASLRKEQGRVAEAIALFERALVIKGATFAPDHPEIEEIRFELDSLRAGT
ncbi:MAG TPA: tetratricopeptide repeat-containing protein, partial [Candidatus Baltobacteraceae bacterium]|nr:tetratricopeptide repeat-containing protein [Candidatus Baltobacteraceae bacterium]